MGWEDPKFDGVTFMPDPCKLDQFNNKRGVCTAWFTVMPLGFCSFIVHFITG